MGPAEPEQTTPPGHNMGPQQAHKPKQQAHKSEQAHRPQRAKKSSLGAKVAARGVPPTRWNKPARLARALQQCTATAWAMVTAKTEAANSRLSHLWDGPLALPPEPPGAGTLQALATQCQQYAPVVAASLRQQATSLSITAYRHSGEPPVAQDPTGLLITGGHEQVEAIPAALRPHMAAQLAAAADDVHLAHLRSLGRCVFGRGASWGAMYGPGSYWHVATWCRLVAAWLDPRYSTQADQRAAHVAGTVAGAVTPLMIWAGIHAFSSAVLAAAARPWAWVTAGVFALYRPTLAAAAAKAIDWVAWEAPVRWPYAVDSLLRHTLPWWQGYASGWNTTRVLWEIMSPTAFSAQTPIPRMTVPSTVADLNASVISVGQHYSRLIDTYPVVNAEPSVASGPDGAVTLATFVEMADDIMARPAVHGPDLSGAGSAVRIMYAHTHGRHRFVVLIPGTQTMSVVPVLNPYTMSQNVHLLAHGEASTSLAAQQALWQERRRQGIADTETVDVLAYGHSQGGIIAAQLARNETFTQRNRVTHVVTTGAPIAGRFYPPKTQFLVLEHIEDVIPKLDLTDSPREPHVVTVQKSVGKDWSRVLDVHRWFVYRDTMNQVLTHDHPALRRIVSEVSAYYGPYHSLVDYPQYRELPPG